MAKIVLDVMTAERGIQEAIQGARIAREKYGCEIVLAGEYQAVAPLIRAHEFGIHRSESIITNNDSPMRYLRDKTSSTYRGLQFVADGFADGFVSPGNTGAIAAIAQHLIAQRNRNGRAYSGYPIMGTFPRLDGRPLYVLDIGATIDSTGQDLLRYGILASTYLEHVLEVDPRIGLLSNGSEPGKGNKAIREAYKLFEQCEEIVFVGNREPEVMSSIDDVVNVLVTDGFAGNLFLKTAEETARRFVPGLVKKALHDRMTFLLTLPGALGLYRAGRAIYHDVSSDNRGGAIVLGIEKPVIIGHGNSKAGAMAHAIGMAAEASDHHLAAVMQTALRMYDTFLSTQNH